MRLKKNQSDLEYNEESEEKSRGVRPSVWIALVCVLLVSAVLLTYAMTATSLRNWYLKQLERSNPQVITPSTDLSDAGEQLQILAEAVRQYSYYANSMSEEEMLKAAFNAYVAASGDHYAEYYSAEDYAELLEQSTGDYCGIGVTVTNKTTVYNGTTYLVFEVNELDESGPAFAAGMKANDLIIAVGDSMETISSLGYDTAITRIRGEENTSVKIWFLRDEGGTLLLNDLTIQRKKLTSSSVKYKLLEGTPKIGFIRITGFELYTPKQFKEAMENLLNQGAEKFVFDVRSNPGGNLLSIKAILSYFLSEGDLVLKAIDKDNNVAQEYCVEACSYYGTSADCSVSKSEIGMYKNLDMVVLCNGSTASAAEVFTASMRDYGLAQIVGQTTFGKGIMQTTRAIQMGTTIGYVKLTTHAYVTKCGESYHGVGIIPTEENTVALPEEAKEYAISMLPYELDTQLQRAVTILSAD